MSTRASVTTIRCFNVDTFCSFYLGCRAEAIIRRLTKFSRRRIYPHGYTFISLVLCIVSPTLEARPISYSGGSTLMAFSNQAKHSVYTTIHPPINTRWALRVSGTASAVTSTVT